MYGCNNNTTTIAGDMNTTNSQSNGSDININVEDLVDRCVARLGYGANEENQNQNRHRVRTFFEDDGVAADVAAKRFKEILERLEKMPTDVAQQFQQEDGPIQEGLRTAMKTCLSKRRNDNDHGIAGEDIADRFDQYTNVESPTRASNSGHKNFSPISKESLVEELISNPRKFLNMMGSDSGPMLAEGMFDHLENILRVIVEIREGEIRVPHVNKEGLKALTSNRNKRSLCDKMGDSIYLHDNCFVSLSVNDKTGMVDENEIVRSEVMQMQRVPCCIGQCLELLYHNGDEAVIEFNSISLIDSQPALTFVFNEVCSEKNLTKCTINAPPDMACMIDPSVLRTISSNNTCNLQFTKCQLNHEQAMALSFSQCPIVFDRSPIASLQDLLFSKDSEVQLKVAFVEESPKFCTLLPYIKSYKLKALIFQKIDLGSLYFNHDLSKEESTYIAVSELRSLVRACLAKQQNGAITCDILLGELTEDGKTSLQCKFDPSVWQDEESINFIQQLGTSDNLWSYKPGATDDLLSQGQVSAQNVAPPPPSLSTFPNTWGNTFLRPTGVWVCQVCSVQNKDELTHCASCEAPNDKHNPEERPAAMKPPPKESLFAHSYPSVDSTNMCDSLETQKAIPQISFGHLGSSATSTNVSNLEAQNTASNILFRNPDSSATSTNLERQEGVSKISIGYPGHSKISSNITSDFVVPKVAFEYPGPSISSAETPRLDKKSTSTIPIGYTSSSGSSTSKTTLEAEKAIPKNSTGISDSSIDVTVIETIREKGCRKMELLRRGLLLHWRFTGYQKKSFEMQVGECETVHADGTTVELLWNGHLQYNLPDGIIKCGKVPLGATQAKFWCANCGSKKKCGKPEHRVTDGSQN